MIAFLANTPEALGWLFTHLVQAPALLAAVRDECDALHSGSSAPGEEGDYYALHSANFKRATPYLHSALFETFRLYVFTGTPATVVSPCTLPGMGDHVFRPGDILHSMGEAAGLDVGVYGDDARVWKGHRFVGDEGEGLLKYDLTFGTGRSRECLRPNHPPIYIPTTHPKPQIPTPPPPPSPLVLSPRSTRIHGACVSRSSAKTP